MVMKRQLLLAAVLLGMMVGAETPPPVRIAVMDFSSIDTRGQSFLESPAVKLSPHSRQTLNAEDRKSINSVMQGFIRMIDAWDGTRDAAFDRRILLDENERNWAKAVALYQTVVSGPSRPMVIGAEYFTAQLGSRSSNFSCIGPEETAAAMKKAATTPDFPRGAFVRLIELTGANYLVTGTVSDLRSRVSSFKGYGIETRTTTWQLDVILRLIDLENGSVVHGGVYTGTLREQEPVSVDGIDNNKFQTLMNMALKKAADEFAGIAEKLAASAQKQPESAQEEVKK